MINIYNDHLLRYAEYAQEMFELKIYLEYPKLTGGSYWKLTLSVLSLLLGTIGSLAY